MFFFLAVAAMAPPPPSCAGRCGGKAMVKAFGIKFKCYCDSKCMMWEDCCTDFADECPAEARAGR